MEAMKRVDWVIVGLICFGGLAQIFGLLLAGYFYVWRSK
jgi:hypothetical protein